MELTYTNIEYLENRVKRLEEKIEQYNDIFDTQTRVYDNLLKDYRRVCKEKLDLLEITTGKAEETAKYVFSLTHCTFNKEDVTLGTYNTSLEAKEAMFEVIRGTKHEPSDFDISYVNNVLRARLKSNTDVFEVFYIESLKL